jgi:arsenite methyltransferase
MSATLHFDDETSQLVEACYTTPDVISQRCDVLSALNLRLGERVLDVGSGPGFLALAMADAVGRSGSVCAIDPSESMVAMTRMRCADRVWVEARVGESDVLPYSDRAFDVVVATQVLEYVADVKKSLHEAFRVLRSEGRFLALDTDWDSIVWHSTDRSRMARVLNAWEEHLTDPRLPRTLASLLKTTGFVLQRQEVIPLLNTEYDSNSYSHGLADLIMRFVPKRKGIDYDEVLSWAKDLETLGQIGAYFFNLNRYLFLAIKPTA